MSTLVRRLEQDYNSLKDCEIIADVIIDGDNLLQWTVTLEGPKDTIFEDGLFKLSMTFTEDYPCKPPSIRFIPKMFHPNICEDGRPCLDILNENWNANFDIAMVLRSLRLFLNEPNPESPANLRAAILYVRNIEKYNDTVWRLVQAYRHGDTEDAINGILSESCAEAEPANVIAKVRFGQDFTRLLSSNVDGFQNLYIVPEDIPTMVGTVIGPNGSFYENQLFSFEIRFSIDYPMGNVLLQFTSKIVHPNVNRVNGVVNQELLGEWRTRGQYRLVALLNALRWLLCEPNADCIANVIAAARFGIRKSVLLADNVKLLLANEADRFRSTKFPHPAGITAEPVDLNYDLWQGVVMGPNDSQFAGQVFSVSIEIPSNYPVGMPQVRFISEIIHPNVDAMGRMNALEQFWHPTMTMTDLFLAVQHLLREPGCARLFPPQP